jgi:hypothetical protein
MALLRYKGPEPKEFRGHGKPWSIGETREVDELEALWIARHAGELFEDADAEKPKGDKAEKPKGGSVTKPAETKQK